MSDKMHNTRHTITLYSSLLESCSSAKNLKTLKKTHARTIILGLSQHDFIRAKLVSSYANCYHIQEASYIFSVTNRQSTFLFNTMIRCLSSLNLFHQSLQLFRHMLRLSKPPDRHTFPSILKSSAALPSLSLGRQLHASLFKHLLHPDVAVSNSLLSMYSKSGDLLSACRVFDTMPNRNLITWSTMIAAYGLHGDADGTMALFDDMLELGVSPDAMTFTSLLTACRHRGMVEMGWRVWRMMEGFNVKPGLEHYTCMVDLLGGGGYAKEAVQLIEDMDVEPDEPLWRALFGACRMQGNVHAAERLYDRLYNKALSV